jgi:hypothetical protein
MIRVGSVWSFTDNGGAPPVTPATRTPLKRKPGLGGYNRWIYSPLFLFALELIRRITL